jgi:hypothetical protein
LRHARRLWTALLVALPALVAIRIAHYSGVVGTDVVPEFLRIVAVSTLLFAVTGFGLTRFLLPDGLRRHELLWVLPIGATGTALAMTVLGFLTVPYRFNLAFVLVAGAALSLYALRRHGLPRVEDWRAHAWPVYLGFLLMCVALVPLFRSGFLTVIGDGSDAHLAAGTAEFLKHAPPRGIDASLPVDQMPLVWRSKHGIYYAFASVSSLSGLETWQVLSVLGAFLLSLAAVGWFVFARDVLGGGVGIASVALVIAGLDRMVIHTGIHPYFNQTWGYLAVPFAITAAWWVVRHPSLRGFGLLGVLLIVCAFAYPLAVPIPLLVLAVMWWVDRRRRRREGEHPLGLRDVWRRFRRLPRWVQAIGCIGALTLLAPAYGAWEKLVGATQLLLSPRYSLELWGGDLTRWYPEQWFFAIRIEGPAWWLAMAVVAGFAAYELWQLPRPARFGLLSVIAAAILVAGTMRLREYGWYFHFKMLAFIGPLVVVLAVVGVSRARARLTATAVRAVLVLGLVVWIGSASNGARDEVATTFDELPLTTQELRTWSEELPAGSSIRLDAFPGSQLWIAYMLHDHPLCSQNPIDDTSYPHVPRSRAADYVLARHRPKPTDAVGAALFNNTEYQLYKLKPGLPGGDNCSQRMVQTVDRIEQG